MAESCSEREQVFVKISGRVREEYNMLEANQQGTGRGGMCEGDGRLMIDKTRRISTTQLAIDDT